MITTITTLPPVPSRNDPGTFSDKADALLGAMPTLVTELNTFVSEVNTLSFKTACKVATTTNLANLVRPVTIDGQTINVGDRVLVKNQSNTAQNGIYIAAGDNIVWTRAPDMDTVEEVAGSFVPVTYGVTNGGKIFYTTFNATGSTLNTTAIPWNSLTEASITGIGTVAVANGGTGLASYTAGDLIYANGTTSLVKLAAAASGNVLKSGTAPSWGKVALASDVSGTLPVANGGTGLTSSIGSSGVTYLTANGTGGWTETNLPTASTSSSGMVRLATTAEVQVGTISDRPITPATLRGGALVVETAKPTTSGLLVDFTGIPSWVKRITVFFNNVSTSGSSNLLIQLGAGSITNTGYNSIGATISNAGAGAAASTTGFAFSNGNIVAGSGCYGSATFSVQASNIWAGQGMLADTGRGFIQCTSGSVTLPGTLDRIRLTTVNGTDTFDSGSINIVYE